MTDPQACSYCGTTDPAKLDWPAPWPTAFVIPREGSSGIRVCLGCAPEKLTVLSVDHGKIEDSDAVRLETTLTFDAVICNPNKKD